MNRYRAILFDLFHTLVDVAAAPGASGRYTADILGFDREAWHRACFSHQHEITRPTEHLAVIRALAHSIDPGVPEALIREANAERQARFDHALRSVEPAVLSVLQGLKAAGYRLVLVSNASTGEVAAWPDSPLAGLFDHALFSCECGMRKPQEGIYREALRRADATAEAALFVGDGGSDEHRGARQAGLTTVLLKHYLSANRRRERQGVAHHELERLDELPGLLERITRKSC